MGDFFNILLWPIRWVIEAILVGAHWFWTTVGMKPEDGLTWVLSVLVLVAIVRAALIPVFIKQVKSMRKMAQLAPEIQRIQKKYKGKTDRYSREQQQREMTAVYSEAGTNPMSSCLPLLIQMPIFFGLFSVLNGAQHDTAGVGALTPDLAASFANAELFGAPLRATLLNNGGNGAVIAIAVTMIIIMVVSQFTTQLAITSKNMSAQAKEAPTYRMQQIMLYILPLIFVFSGLAFPLGVMSYWVLSNLWTTVQQWLITRRYPTPGSEMAERRKERLARHGRVDETLEPQKAKKMEQARSTITMNNGQPAMPQRQQPMSKKRAKKNTAAGKGGATAATSQVTAAAAEPMESPASESPVAEAPASQSPKKSTKKGSKNA